MLLSLPTLSSSIPYSYRFGSLGLRQLKMALVLSRLGWLTDDDVSSIVADAVDASDVLTVLENGWQRALGGRLDYGVLSIEAALLFPSKEDLGIEFDEAAVVYNATTPEWIAGGRVFEALEAESKGLGRTVLFQIESVLSWFGSPHSISGVLEMCSHTEWMGEENEDRVIEEYGESAEDIDIVRFADVVKDVPEWAYSFKGEEKVLSTKALQQQATRLKKKTLGKLVAAIVRIRELTIGTSALFGNLCEEFEILEPPVVIGWNTAEQFDQFIDMYHDFYYQGDTAQFAGGLSFEISESGVSSAIEQMRTTGEVLKALDEAVTLIRDMNAQLTGGSNEL